MLGGVSLLPLRADHLKYDSTKTDGYQAKYNYVLAAALDTGLALSAIIIFFCITYPGAVFPDWWGMWLGSWSFSPIRGAIADNFM